MTEVPSAGRSTGSLNEPLPHGSVVVRAAAHHAGEDPRVSKPAGEAGSRSAWAETFENASEAAGLVGLGVNVEEDRVAISSSTRLYGSSPTWRSSGAATRPSTQPEDVDYILGDSGTVCLIAEEMSQVSKADRASLPDVKNFVVIDRARKVITWEQLREQGRALWWRTPN